MSKEKEEQLVQTLNELFNDFGREIVVFEIIIPSILTSFKTFAISIRSVRDKSGAILTKRGHFGMRHAEHLIGEFF